MRLLRPIVTGALVVLGAYLVGRAILEPFLIDYGNPSDYARDWGGPSVIGVMAVHMVPGLVSLAGLTWWVSRRVERRGGHTRRSSPPAPGRPSP